MMQNQQTRIVTGKCNAQHSANSLSGWAFAVCSFIFAAGCQGSGQMELLEARLREQEHQLQSYEREVVNAHSQLEIAQRESRILRKQLADTGETNVAAEATQSIAAVEGVKFNGLLTGGQNNDAQPGDERFHTIAYPVDHDGEIVKLIGKVTLEAIDLSQPEGERTVGKWEYTPEEAQELWHVGFLSSGYRFELPWTKLPQSKEILLRIEFESPDGREFTASHTVKIDPPSNLQIDPNTPDLIAPPMPPVQTAKVEQAAEESPKAEPKEEEQADSEEKGVATLEEVKPQRPAPLVQQVSFESGDAVDKKTANAMVEKDGAPAVEDQPAKANPRPFPGGTQTSDNWTDATIPAWR